MKDQQKDDAKEEGPRSFSRFIAQLADEEADGECSRQLHALMKLLREESGALGGVKVKGALTLKIAFAVEHTTKHPVVQIAYDVTTKAPKRRTSPSTFWMTKGNNLTPENPAQQTLPLRDVSVPNHASARDLAANQGKE